MLRKSLNLLVERSGDVQKGIELLEQMDIKNLLVRKFLLDYLQRVDNHQKICEVFITPQTIDEAIAVIESCVKLKDSRIEYGLLFIEGGEPNLKIGC